MGAGMALRQRVFGLNMSHLIKWLRIIFCIPGIYCSLYKKRKLHFVR